MPSFPLAAALGLSLAAGPAPYVLEQAPREHVEEISAARVFRGAMFRIRTGRWPKVRRRPGIRRA